MRSRTTARFRKALAELPADVQEQAREAYRKFQENPRDPSLRFKQEHATLPIYSARVGLQYRAVGERQGDDVIAWFWIGSHAEYDQLLRRRPASAVDAPPAVRGAPGVTGEDPGGTHGRIHSVVRRIPPGRVLTYGDVAALAELPRHARLVGYALHALPEHTAVPWHRVVNHRGGISTGRAWPGGQLAQRRLLEAEGVAFDANGRLSLERHRWTPPVPLPEPIDLCG